MLHISYLDPKNHWRGDLGEHASRGDSDPRTASSFEAPILPPVSDDRRRDGMDAKQPALKPRLALLVRSAEFAEIPEHAALCFPIEVRVVRCTLRSGFAKTIAYEASRKRVSTFSLF